jgi:hypothetical protein
MFNTTVSIILKTNELELNEINISDIVCCYKTDLPLYFFFKLSKFVCVSTWWLLMPVQEMTTTLTHTWIIFPYDYKSFNNSCKSFICSTILKLLVFIWNVNKVWVMLFYKLHFCVLTLFTIYWHSSTCANSVYVDSQHVCAIWWGSTLYPYWSEIT